MSGQYDIVLKHRPSEAYPWSVSNPLKCGLVGTLHGLHSDVPWMAGAR